MNELLSLMLTSLSEKVFNILQYISPSHCVAFIVLSPDFSQCLKQYVELLIKEGLETAISCPDAACPKRGHLQENEVRSLYIFILHYSHAFF